MKLRENTITRIGLWLFVMLLCSNAVVGQTASMNYVRKSQMTAPYTSNPTIDFENARITIDYYDGLGRPIQTIQQGSAPLEDQIMIDSFKTSSSQRYDLFNQNCATAVGDALNKAFKTNFDEILPSKLYKNIVNRISGKEIIRKDGTI